MSKPYRKRKASVPLPDDTRLFEGRMFKGKKQGDGVLHLSDGSVMNGHWVDDMIVGPAVLTDSDGDKITGRVELDGTTSPSADSFCGPCVQSYSDGSIKFVGSLVNGVRNGVGIQYNPDGSSLEGCWVDDLFQGHENIYRYPDGVSMLKGIWDEGVMVAATFIGAPNHSTKKKYKKFKFFYDPSTDVDISRNPLIEDPYEEDRVVVKQSTVPGGGQGLFARCDLPRGSTVAYYTGLRLKKEIAFERPGIENEYTINLSEGDFVVEEDGDDDDEELVLSVPVDMADPSRFCSTLGHKINHSDTNDNCVFDFCIHPRFGPIRTIVACEDIQAGQELFIDYCRESHKDDDDDDTHSGGGEKIDQAAQDKFV